MSLRVYAHEGGPFTEVENVEQAAQLMKLFSNGHRQLALNIPQVEVATNPEDSVKAFFASINQNAQGFLLALSKHPKGVEAETLSRETGQETSVFGGILGGLSKNAGKHNLKTKSVVISEMRFEGARRFRHFQPGPILLKYSAMLVNPEPSWKAETRKMLAEKEEEEIRSGKIKSGGGA